MSDQAESFSRNSIVKRLEELADDADKVSKKARRKSSVWINAGLALSVSTAVVAFIAGFSGLNKWVGPDGVVAWSFLSGLLGVVSVVVNKSSDIEGVPERIRSQALKDFALYVRNVVTEYEAYAEALRGGEPIEGFETQAAITTWLREENRKVTEQRKTLRKFVYKHDDAATHRFT